MLDLGQTIGDFGLDKAVAADLLGRVRDAGKDVATGNVKNACRDLSGLSKAIAAQAAKGKLSAARRRLCWPGSSTTWRLSSAADQVGRSSDASGAGASPRRSALTQRMTRPKIR